MGAGAVVTAMILVGAGVLIGRSGRPGSMATDIVVVTATSTTEPPGATTTISPTTTISATTTTVPVTTISPPVTTVATVPASSAPSGTAAALPTTAAPPSTPGRQAQLGAIAKQAGAADWSKVAETRFGPYGVVISDGLTILFHYESGAWQQIGEYESPTLVPAVKVTTLDVTQDGVYDFVVEMAGFGAMRPSAPCWCRRQMGVGTGPSSSIRPAAKATSYARTSGSRRAGLCPMSADVSRTASTAGCSACSLTAGLGRPLPPRGPPG